MLLRKWWLFEAFGHRTFGQVVGFGIGIGQSSQRCAGGAGIGITLGHQLTGLKGFGVEFSIEGCGWSGVEPRPVKGQAMQGSLEFGKPGPCLMERPQPSLKVPLGIHQLVLTHVASATLSGLT
jgi:hypothetical protein